MLTLWLIATLAACGGKDDDTGPAASTGDGGSVDVFTPSSGTWTATAVDVDTTTCGPADAQVVAGWQLVLINSGGWYFDLENGDDRILCSLDGEDFLCDVYEFSTVSDAGTASFNLSWTTSGTFASADLMAMTIEESRPCDGPGCTELEEAGGYTYPCALTYNVEFAAG